MSVTGTTTFTASTQDVIEYSLSKCGALELGVSADSVTLTKYTKQLNMMIKRMITKGVKLWTLTELTLPFTASKTTYIVGPASSGPGTPDLVTDKPMKLMQAWLRNVSVTPNTDIPLQVISQHNYNEFGSKFSISTPNSVYLNVGREQSIVELYTTPDASASSLYQLHLLVQRPLYDVVATTDNLDFPVEWLSALGWSFAEEIMLDFGCSEGRQAAIIRMATKLLEEAESFDTEYNSIFFTPDMRNRGGR